MLLKYPLVFFFLRIFLKKIKIISFLILVLIFLLFSLKKLLSTKYGAENNFFFGTPFLR